MNKLVVNADLWTELVYSELCLGAGDLAPLVLVDNPEHNPRGDFSLSGNRISSEGESCKTFSGVGLYHPALFAHCSPGAFPLAPLLREAMSYGKVSGEYYSGNWVDVGTPERYWDLDQAIRRKTGQAIF